MLEIKRCVFRAPKPRMVEPSAIYALVFTAAGGFCSVFQCRFECGVVGMSSSITSGSGSGGSGGKGGSKGKKQEMGVFSPVVCMDAQLLMFATFIHCAGSSVPHVKVGAVWGGPADWREPSSTHMTVDMCEFRGCGVWQQSGRSMISRVLIMGTSEAPAFLCERGSMLVLGSHVYGFTGPAVQVRACACCLWCAGVGEGR